MFVRKVHVFELVTLDAYSIRLVKLTLPVIVRPGYIWRVRLESSGGHPCGDAGQVLSEKATTRTYRMQIRVEHSRFMKCRSLTQVPQYHKRQRQDFASVRRFAHMQPCECID